MQYTFIVQKSIMKEKSTSSYHWNILVSMHPSRFSCVRIWKDFSQWKVCFEQCSVRLVLWFGPAVVCHCWLPETTGAHECTCVCAHGTWKWHWAWPLNVSKLFSFWELPFSCLSNRTVLSFEEFWEDKMRLFMSVSMIHRGHLHFFIPIML